MNFTKLVASGNDFILLDLRRQNKHLNLRKITKQVCNRKLGIGADGLLVLEKSKRANVKMRIFNADGSEAEMCGNGARCVVYFLMNAMSKARSQIRIETKAGILRAQVNQDNVKINMTNPKNIKLDMTIRLKKHPLRFNFINTGVPHTVILCEGIEKMDVHSLGRLIRFHKRFKPAGTNVNFVEPIDLSKIKIRTYERGVEEETLACGTGSVAAAIIYMLKLRKSGLIKEDRCSIEVDTVSGEILKVYFDIYKNKINNVWLEGKARIICKGQVKT
ncbi:MAG: diaminopimelate epimerase [Candidatus Omnitrophica bacterium]|nr:diaminopimelate epimerase [Candidatus Omnitrophota bacterium]